MWHHVLHRLPTTAGVALAASLLGTSAVGQTITFRKVADTNTPVPGGVGTFTGFTSTPVIDRGNVAFEGTAPNPVAGIYTDIGGTLRPVATSNTPNPSGTGTFVSPFEPSIDDGRVAFRANVTFGAGIPLVKGVYLETSGTIVVVAETGMLSPGGGVFDFFESNARARPSVNAGNVAFAARTSDAGFGVFLSSGGTLSVVADGNTLTPGRTTPFGFVGQPYLSGDNVAFFGRESAGASSVTGVYARIGGVLQVVADNTMMAPGGTTTFNGPVSPVIDGTDIAFTDLGSVPGGPDAQEGAYTYFDGVLNIGILVAPTGPGSPSLENRTVVANRGPGIITTNMGGSEFRVIGTGDVLDGKPLSIAYQSHEAISGNEIVFFAFFDNGTPNNYDDDTQGIYVAKILLFCGDNVVDPGEECDDGGSSATCDADCTFSACGDGTLNTLAGEECDEGANNSDTTPDACRTSCLLASCGDGVADTGEACDDAGPSAVCDADCTPAVCGDSTTNTLAGEQCDDGNRIDGDGCQGDCRLPVCGDGIIDAGEACDDGALNSDIAADACRSDCTLARCGDGVTDSTEACDDGNTDNGDGCSADCEIEVINIPTASIWGLVVLGLLLCVGARLQFGRRMATAKAK